MKSFTFYKGLSWLLVLNLLVKPVWIFFIDRQVQNIIGYEAYGKYFAILNLSYVLFFLTDIGLSNMLNQRLANTQLVNVRQILRIKFFLFAFYLVACCFIAWLSKISDWEIVLYVIIAQALNSMFIFCRSLITAHQHFTADAWFSIVDKLLMVMFCGTIIYTSLLGSIHLIIFLQMQMFCTAAALVLAFIFLIKNKLIHTGKKENPVRLLKTVTPFALIVLLMSAHYRLDGFLLERIHTNGALEAGIYASAYRLVDAANMVGYLFASFLIPFISRHLDDNKLVNDVVLKTRHGLMFYSISIVAFAMIFGSWIQQLFYHSDHIYNSTVIQLSLASLPGYFLVHLYGSVLTAIARFNLFIRILLGSVLLNLILNLILIPSQGALGSSIAALISQFLCGIACCIAATRGHSLSLHPKGIILYIVYAVLLTAFFYMANITVGNVWIILLIATGIFLVFLAIQPGVLKKYLISLR